MVESCSEDGSSTMSRLSSEEEMKLMPVETFSNAPAYRTHNSQNPRKKWTILAISVVSFLLFLTFASIYGSDEVPKIEEEVEEPQFAEIRNISTYQEPERSCGKRDEAANMTIWNDVVNKTSNLTEDMFTIAIQTYKRPTQLKKTIQHLVENKVPSLYEIVVVWNEINVEPPSDFMSEHGVLVRYRRSEKNSLNQKFLPDPDYRTQGILLSDDDWNYNTTGDLEYAFQQWRRAGMHRLTGAFARCWTLNEVTETPIYSFNCKGQDTYSMILTGMAFTHISYLEYYHSEDEIMTSVREFVDESFNCEDIALNFVASMLTCEGPLLVLGKDKLDNQHASSGISSKPGHILRRRRKTIYPRFSSHTERLTLQQSSALQMSDHIPPPPPPAPPLPASLHKSQSTEPQLKLKVKSTPEACFYQPSKPPAQTDLSEPPIGPYFVYGTLMDPNMLSDILGLEKEPKLRLAKIKGYSRKLWGQYPAMQEGPGDAEVNGSVYQVQSIAQAKRLAEYETNSYRVMPCHIHYTDGNKPADELGSIFMYVGNPRDLCDGEFDLAQWLKRMGRFSAS
ncbi:unnamed protein product [Fusarium graminearum]|nr:unnamed protein product [Fusarium graminearum]